MRHIVEEEEEELAWGEEWEDEGASGQYQLGSSSGDVEGLDPALQGALAQYRNLFYNRTRNYPPEDSVLLQFHEAGADPLGVLLCVDLPMSHDRILSLAQAGIDLIGAAEFISSGGSEDDLVDFSSRSSDLLLASWRMKSAEFFPMSSPSRLDKDSLGEDAVAAYFASARLPESRGSHEDVFCDPSVLYATLSFPGISSASFSRVLDTLLWHHASTSYGRRTLLSIPYGTPTGPLWLMLKAACLHGEVSVASATKIADTLAWAQRESSGAEKGFYARLGAAAAAFIAELEGPSQSVEGKKPRRSGPYLP